MVIIGDDAYPINTDFRVGIAFCEKLISGEPMSVQEMYELWFPEKQPDDVSAAQAAIFAFYRCGKEPGKQGTKQVPAYDFFTDGDNIVADFQREYGIDLTTEKMHWWRFSALLGGLLSHSFTEKVQYRNCDLNEIESKRMRGRYRKLQQEYALAPDGKPVRRPQTLEEYQELLLKQARGE